MEGLRRLKQAKKPIPDFTDGILEAMKKVLETDAELQDFIIGSVRDHSVILHVIGKEIRENRLGQLLLDTVTGIVDANISNTSTDRLYKKLLLDQFTIRDNNFESRSGFMTTHVIVEGKLKNWELVYFVPNGRRPVIKVELNYVIFYEKLREVHRLIEQAFSDTDRDDLIKRALDFIDDFEAYFTYVENAFQHAVIIFNTINSIAYVQANVRDRMNALRAKYEA